MICTSTPRIPRPRSMRREHTCRSSSWPVIRDSKANTSGTRCPPCPSGRSRGSSGRRRCGRDPDGTNVLYYSTPATIPLGCLAKVPPTGCVKTTNGESSAMCISRATSANPAGPFVDDSSSAFVCPLAQGGAIDPSVFVAPDGTPWLLWKSDGDCCNMPTDDLFPAALGRRALGGRSGPSADRGDPELGGESGRGAVDDRERQHLLALLLGQSLGNRQLRHRRGALCHRRRALYQTARPCLALVDGLRGTE